MIETLNEHMLSLGKRLFKPIVIGGMGVDISTSELALTAARLGGIGHISDAMAPYVCDKKHRTKYQHGKLVKYQREEPEDSNPRWDSEVVYEASQKHASTTMNAKRGSGAVFVNVMEKLTMGASQETLRARIRGALDGGIDGVTLSAGLHSGTMRLIEDHPRFKDALIGIIVSSARALKIFLRGAARASRLPDYIVVEGPLAGGHLGFGLDWKKYNLREIVAEVLSFLKKQELNIPVIPAGGVFSGADAADFINRGAKALQVATRFVISKECGLPEKVKQKYLLAGEEDIVVNMTSPTGYPMRMLKSSPSLHTQYKPNCEALGYILDDKGHCSYKSAYEAAPVDEHGNKTRVKELMCICNYFMRHQCYTCGHNVYRLKDTTEKLPNGEFYLPSAEQIFDDYLYNREPTIATPPEAALSLATA